MRLRPIIFLLILFPLASCAAFPSFTLDAPPDGSAELEKAKTLFEEGKYGEAASLYRKLSKSGQKNIAETAQFQIGRTLAFYKNPKRDYPEALIEFQIFVKRFPQSQIREDASNWVFILDQYLTKKTENDKLKEDIRKLVDIDIEVEKKQRGIK